MFPSDLLDRAQALQARQAALDAEQLDLLLEVERQANSQLRGAEAFLRNGTGVARSTAHVRSSVARQLLVLPSMREALANAWVTFDHARALADHADSPNRDQVLDDESELTEWAFDVSADDYRARLATWARDLDEQRAVELTEHERRRRLRRVRRSRTRDGLRRTVIELDEQADAVFWGAVRGAAHEMRRADSTAKLAPEQLRTTAQYLADGIVEVAHRSRGADVITKHRARPLILALTEMSVLWDQLRVNGVCELDDGTQLTGAELRRLACEADIIPIVLSGDGVPLDVGRTFRLATYWQRLALRALHATCAVEGCDVPFDQCEVHHLRPWEKGGRTDLDNLVPLCSYHHTWVHDLDGNVVLELLPDRTLRLPGFPVRPCAARRRRLVDRLKAPPDLVGTR